MKGGIEVGALLAWFEEKNFADDAEDVFAAFFRRDVFLDFAGEEDQANLVVIADGGEGEDGGDFGGEFALGLFAGTEQTGAGKIDDEHDGQFAFFDELFDEGMIHSRGDVPVDGADFVAGLVLADFFEVHALAFEDAVVLPCHRFVDETEGAQFDLTDLFEDILWDHAERLWDGEFVEDLLDDRFAGLFLGFGFVGDGDAVAEDVHADTFDILRGDVAAAFQESVGFGGEGK